MPTGIPEQVVHLDLSQNSIRHLKAKDFQGARSLRTLNFSNNNLEQFDKGLCAIITAYLLITISEYYGMCFIFPVISGWKPTQNRVVFFLWLMNNGKVENVLSNCCWLLFSWLSAIFVYTVLDLFIVEKAESVTGIKWSLCWSDSDTNWTAACILQSVIAPIAFFNVFVNINSNRCVLK